MRRWRVHAVVQGIHMFGGLWLLAALASCSPPVQDEVFATQSLTTEQVWYGATPRTGPWTDQVAANSAGAVTGMPGAAAWTRSAETELDLGFPTLPNPRLLLYVFPHLTTEGAPVPGYVTGWYLYEQAGHFALPGEAFRQGIWR